MLACSHKEVAQGFDQDMPATPDLSNAEVLSVQVNGSEMAYSFSVEVHSPDTGCDQYADWWEVVSQDTILKYRRILAHSHVDEQPFRRSGGIVPIHAAEEVYIRAHMNTLGYGVKALMGSVKAGFQPVIIDTSFGGHLIHTAPLPDGCAF